LGRAQALTAIILLLFLAGCSDERPRITVGSKNFLEQVLLGEIAAQHLERRLGSRIGRKLNLGGTLLAHGALVNGDIDLYPEYVGTGASAVLGLPPSKEPDELLSRVRLEYQQRYDLIWLDPLGFNNTFAMVIRRTDAERHHLGSLSDAARAGAGWTLGVGYEFQQRPDGLPNLLHTYQIPLAGAPKVMDLGLLYRALEQQMVNMVAGNATDGLLLSLDVTVLEDDRGIFPPYHAAFVLRGESVRHEPRMMEALQQLSGTLSGDTMRRLNHEVILHHGQVQEVAAMFLKEAGLSQ
jgi:glycine betaine/choline ABC-type transport system substrate-binding protein